MKTTNLKKLGISLLAVSALGVVANVVPVVGVLNPVVVRAQERTDQAIDYRVNHYQADSEGVSNSVSAPIHEPTTGYLNPGESTTLKPIEIQGYTPADPDYKVDVNYDQLAGKTFLYDMGRASDGTPSFFFTYKKDPNYVAPKDQSADPANTGDSSTTPSSDSSQASTPETPQTTSPSSSSQASSSQDTQASASQASSQAPVTPPVAPQTSPSSAQAEPTPAPESKETSPQVKEKTAPAPQTTVTPSSTQAKKPATPAKKTLPQTGESASVLSISLGTLTLGLAGLILGKGRYQARHGK